jgi:hypothetical protein|tara:strand:- start:1654 stop:2790 length:1137 start_codon:yes stop_codon:yes gene_type:complete
MENKVPGLNKMKEMLSGLMTNKATMVKYAAYALIAVMMIGLISYTINKMNLGNVNCDTIEKMYPSFPSISSFNVNDSSYQYKLRDYYIKTAYNCCCSGQFKNDWVGECALKACIKQGARVLDFEIYSVNDEPVVATSAVKNYTVKQTYNDIPLKTAMQIVNNYAFTGGSCPNPNDPLILHFRISSNNEKIYKKMADTIYSTIGPKLLGKEYSYEYNGQNLGTEPLSTFVNKIIISVDRSNPLYETTPLKEYVNIASNSVFLRGSREYDVKFTPDSNELIEFNKKNMSFTMPDLSVSNNNVSSALSFSYGCQWVGMCFQNFDANMEFYSLYFDKIGHAFALKPENLRFVPATIPNPTPQSPENSYTTRTTKTDYYSVSV